MARGVYYFPFFYSAVLQIRKTRTEENDKIGSRSRETLNSVSSFALSTGPPLRILPAGALAPPTHASILFLLPDSKQPKTRPSPSVKIAPVLPFFSSPSATLRPLFFAVLFPSSSPSSGEIVSFFVARTPQASLFLSLFGLLSSQAFVRLGLSRFSLRDPSDQSFFWGRNFLVASLACSR